jgi:hypothetical protein
MSTFLSKDNVKLMWDVVTEQDIFLSLSPSNKNKLLTIFQTNVIPYYDTEKINTSDLMSLNKKYIKLIIKNIASLHVQRIKIHDDNTNELVTYEDIQNDKLSKFDNDLNRIKEDFDNTIKIKIPNRPEFQDKNIDTPITEMEQKLKEITAQRNYDIQQINNDVDKTVVKDWLKPIGTSVKGDRNQNNVNANLNNNNNKLKYLNIEQTEFPSFNTKIKSNKIVSFTETSDDIELKEQPQQFNILKKLKKIDIASKKDDSERITIIEENIKQLNNKIEIILNMLKETNL